MQPSHSAVPASSASQAEDSRWMRLLLTVQMAFLPRWPSADPSGPLPGEVAKEGSERQLLVGRNGATPPY